MRCLVALLAVVAAPLCALAQDVTVSAAISMRDALQEVARVHERRTGQEVGLNFASSGQLMAQVRQGAPVDVFISAADDQMDALERDGLIVADTRSVIAHNRLVLIVPAGTAQAIRGFDDLTSAGVRRIAIGQPSTVPAGLYATQVLERLGLDERLADRLIHASNVRQVLNYVERGEVDAGLVYATDVLAIGTDRVRIVATADASLHDPIRYPAAVVAGARHADAARAVLDTLGSAEARAILQHHGFDVPDGDDAPATAPAGGRATP